MKTRVIIREFEKGYGSKIDEIKEFSTEEEAVTFVKEFNSCNNLPDVPDWYMTAEID